MIIQDKQLILVGSNHLPSEYSILNLSHVVHV